VVDRIDVITLFPEMILEASTHGVTGRALEQGRMMLQCWNPRDVTEDVHRTVDDRPYGGGPGMVMLAEPLLRTMKRVRQQAPDSKAVYLTPQGRPITQTLLREQQRNLVLLCGRYEGIDERFIDAEIEEEWSLGDFVLSGGEIAALAVIDAMTRLVPGALGHDQSAEQDSFMHGLLDCPHYTRPERWEDAVVPDVLLGGHHEQIARWRMKQSLGRTWQRRPDLLESRRLNDEERKLLSEFIDEQNLKDGT
jgi:tRNA (guanine37-N1)-methyltransferase